VLAGGGTARRVDLEVRQNPPRRGVGQAGVGVRAQVERRAHRVAVAVEQAGGHRLVHPQRLEGGGRLRRGQGVAEQEQPDQHAEVGGRCRGGADGPAGGCRLAAVERRAGARPEEFRDAVDREPASFQTDA
jgi:hypothetical protein